LLAKVDEGEEPKRFVYKKTLSVLARGGDERGVPAVVRVYRRNDEYSESALGTLAEMLSRKRVCKRLTEEQLSELVNLPDHSQPIIGEEADRFATTVYWGERVLSCESVRTLAREEMERRAQRS